MRPTIAALAACARHRAAARGAGQAGARHLHLRELRLRMGPRPGDRRELREGLRLHRALRRRRRRRGAARRGCSSRATRSPADIVLGLDTNLTAEAKATGLFAPHGIEAPDLDLPIAWDDDDLPALRLGLLRLRLRQDEDARPAAELRGADRLRRQHRDPRPAQLDARASACCCGSRTPTATARRRSGRACAPHVVTVAPGWSEAYGLFLDGEADMALAYTTSPAYHLIAENDDDQGGGDLRRGPLHAGRGRRR